MIMKLKDGDVELELYSDKAPNHVKDLKILLKKVFMMELFFIEL